jgi:hypothetical protein
LNCYSKSNSGYLLALAAGQFFVLLMLAESIAPDYSMHDNAISDLGTIAETELLFNASLFLIGLLNLVAGYVLFKAIGDRKVLVVFALGGIGAMGAGLIPLDHPSGAHGLFALLAFVFINVESYGRRTICQLHPGQNIAVPGHTGHHIRPGHDNGGLRFPGRLGQHRPRGVERMIAFPCLIWMLVFGGYLISSPALKGEVPAA